MVLTIQGAMGHSMYQFPVNTPTNMFYLVNILRISSMITAIGSTEGADEKFPVQNVLRRIPQISVSFAPIQMKPSQIFQAN
jgi:hypothetical protein